MKRRGEKFTKSICLAVLEIGNKGLDYYHWDFSPFNMQIKLDFGIVLIQQVNPQDHRAFGHGICVKSGPRSGEL